MFVGFDDKNDFNSHAHVERDIKYSFLNLLCLDFNSHAHVERDNDKTTLKGVAGKDFNSHAHVERDASGLTNEQLKAISTHTLTWSVTYRVTRSIMTL